MRSSKLTVAIAMFCIPLAVSAVLGYVDGNLRWGLINGVVIGGVFAAAALLGVFE